MKSADITGTADGSTYTTTGMVIGGAGYIASPGFFMTSGGALTLKGNVSASSGNIGGWTINGGTMQSADITGTADGTDTTTTGMVIGGTGYIAGPNFLLNTSGNVLARGSSHVFDGNIAAHTLVATGSGVIGAFTIDSASISSTNLQLNNTSHMLMFRDASNDYVKYKTEQVVVETEAGDVTLTTGVVSSSSGTKLVWDLGRDDTYYFSKGKGITWYQATSPAVALSDGVNENAFDATTSNYKGNLSATVGQADNVNAGIRGSNNRGASGGLKVGVYGYCNDHWQSAGVLGEGKYRSDLYSSSWSGVFRYRPFVVGDPWEATNGAAGFSRGAIHPDDNAASEGLAWNDAPDDEYATFIVHPYNSRAGYANSDALRGRVGIRTWIPQYELDVTGTIRATANVIAYSDIRKKENIVTIENGVSLVEQLRGVRFDWKEGFKQKTNTDRDKRQVGLIAQEVEKIIPEVVFTDRDGYKSVSYPNITAVLIEAIKEQQQDINKLKEEVKELQNGNS